jgi:hypothetical protein
MLPKFIVLVEVRFNDRPRSGIACYSVEDVKSIFREYAGKHIMYILNISKAKWSVCLQDFLDDLGYPV